MNKQRRKNIDEVISSLMAIDLVGIQDAIQMIVDDEQFNTKSVMSLLQAGGAIADKGYETVFFEGDARVIEDIKLLAKHNYCEDSEIPSQLSYLRDFNNLS